MSHSIFLLAAETLCSSKKKALLGPRIQGSVLPDRRRISVGPDTEEQNGRARRRVEEGGAGIAEAGEAGRKLEASGKLTLLPVVGSLTDDWQSMANDTGPFLGAASRRIKIFQSTESQRGDTMPARVNGISRVAMGPYTGQETRDMRHGDEDRRRRGDDGRQRGETVLGAEGREETKEGRAPRKNGGEEEFLERPKESRKMNSVSLRRGS
ncbi:hypothetical protein KM043_008740 [Ampulex compressa]|nr:hypothetical protein KM043_008740 [Ampulex compressa]